MDKEIEKELDAIVGDDVLKHNLDLINFYQPMFFAKVIQVGNGIGVVIPANLVKGLKLEKTNYLAMKILRIE